MKLEMRRSASAQPVGEITLAAPPIRELRTALQGLPFGDEVADLVEETYRPGSTMGVSDEVEVSSNWNSAGRHSR